MKKRIIAICASLVLVLSSIILLPFETYAADGDSPMTAIPIDYDKSVRCEITPDMPAVFYSFTTSNLAGIKYSLGAVLVDHENTFDSENLSTEFCLLDSSYQEVVPDNNYYSTWSLYQKGDSKVHTYSRLSNNSTYYIRARSTDFDLIRAQVELRVTQNIQSPAKVSLKSVKPGKSKLTVRYNSASRAERYQIKIKKAGGNWQTYNNGKALTKTIKKLKKGKIYKVKVRAQRMVDGKWYNGQWSKVKSVKIK